MNLDVNNAFPHFGNVNLDVKIVFLHSQNVNLDVNMSFLHVEKCDFGCKNVIFTFESYLGELP